MIEYPKDFPIEALRLIPQQLRGKLNDAKLARLAGWNLIGFGLSIGATMDLTNISTVNAPEDDEATASLFDRAIEAIDKAEPRPNSAPAFSWEQLAPLVWFLINNRWRI